MKVEWEKNRSGILEDFFIEVGELIRRQLKKIKGEGERERERITLNLSVGEMMRILLGKRG